MNHHVIVRNRRISVVGPVMVQSNVAVDTVTVSVDSEYDGLQVALVIGGTQIMYDGEPVTVPSSELERAGDLPLTVLGLSSGKRVVTASAESAFRVVASGAFEGEDPVPDSPDMLQQLADAYKAANAAAGTATEAAKAAQDAVAKVDEAVSDLGDAAANAAAARESAEAAAKSASDAKASESSARASAESASSDAGSASSSATAARQSATEAASSATAAGQSATEAKASADSASESASSASADAQTASQSASAAASAASSANDDAADARSAAEAAQAAATSAQEDASTAQTAAETATTQAQAASSSASAAARSAIDAKASADTAAGWVPADGEPGQLLAKTDSGTAWVDPPSGNTLVGTATGYVAHADDAYAAKPREVRIEGRTVKNLWVNPSGTNGGVTATANENGSITLSGTSSRYSINDVESYALRPGSTYTASIEGTLPSGGSFRVRLYDSDGWVRDIFSRGSGSATFTMPSDGSWTVVRFAVVVESGITVSGTYRVMLVEGSEAQPWCPPGLNSVEGLSLMTAGKNLADIIGSIKDNAKPIPVKEGQKFIASCTASKPIDDAASNSHVYVHNAITRDVIRAMGFTAGTTGRVTSNVFTAPSDGAIIFVLYSTLNLTDVQLEPGSTATAYEPPAVTTTPLPEVELRSLPDGTCDELVIAQDGTAAVERRTQLTGDEVTALPEPTTESLDAVSLPKLPAPTFNAYHDSQVPSDTSVEYERDVNIAYAGLEAKIAALTVAQATS